MKDYVIIRTENGWTVHEKKFDPVYGPMYRPVSDEYEDLKEAIYEWKALKEELDKGLNMRDLLEDLKICQNATPGPWAARSWTIPTDDQYFVREDKEDSPKEIATVWQGVRYMDMPEISAEEAKNNAIFIAAAREGWPHAIERAINAEQMLQILETLVDELEEEVDELRRNLQYQVNANRAVIKKLKEENERLKARLKEQEPA